MRYNPIPRFWFLLAISVAHAIGFTIGCLSSIPSGDEIYVGFVAVFWFLTGAIASGIFFIWIDQKDREEREKNEKCNR